MMKDTESMEGATGMSHKINCEMLGTEGTDAQARRMVELLQARGYEVEYTADGGLVNGERPTDPVSDSDWSACLDQVARETT